MVKNLLYEESQMLKAWKMKLLRLQGILLQRSNVEKTNFEEIF